MSTENEYAFEQQDKYGGGRIVGPGLELNGYHQSVGKEVAAALNTVAAISRRAGTMPFVMAVARKFPAETREQTAVRYINETEERAGASSGTQTVTEKCPVCGAVNDADKEHNCGPAAQAAALATGGEGGGS